MDKQDADLSNYTTPYERIYAREEYVEGREPTWVSERTLELVDFDPPGTVLDVGCGEGRDAVFYADSGFDVIGFDKAKNGLEKTERLANERGVAIETAHGDVNELELDESIDLLHSVSTLQYLAPENRAQQFERFKCMTNAGGVHTVTAYIDAEGEYPDVFEEGEYRFEPDELRSYYDGWEIVHCERTTLNDLYIVDIENPVQWVVARKPTGT